MGLGSQDKPQLKVNMVQGAFSERFLRTSVIVGSVRRLARLASFVPWIGLIMIQGGCLVPVFDSAEVRPGFQGWVGATGFYHSFDHDYADYGDMRGTAGIGGTGGFCYGFDNYVGIGLSASAFTAWSDTGVYRHGEIIVDPSLDLKVEATPPGSSVIASLTVGVGLPPTIRPTIGVRKNGQEFMAFGGVFYLYTFARSRHEFGIFGPYNIFMNLKPFRENNLIFYAGYVTRWLLEHDENAFRSDNIAVGIGYRW